MRIRSRAAVVVGSQPRRQKRLSEREQLKEKKVIKLGKKMTATLLTAIIILSMTPILANADSLQFFCGYVTINGSPAPGGTLVQAKIAGVTKKSFSTIGNTYGMQGGFWLYASTGDTIDFYVDGALACNYKLLAFKQMITLDLSVTIPTGTLSIDTTPVKGKVFVDGGYRGLAPVDVIVYTGTHTVTFGDVAGYTKPDSQTITIPTGETALLTGVYDLIPTGTLSIDTTPVKRVVLVDEAPWGVAPQSEIVAVGTYTVSFGDVAGYTTPVDQEAVVSVGATTEVLGTYVLMPPKPSSLYPVVVTLSTGEKLFIATHTSSLSDGNWIELSGGTPITLPSLILAYEGLESATYERDGVTVTIESSFATGEATYPLATHHVYSAGQTIIVTFWGASKTMDPVDFKLFKLTSVSEIRDIAIEIFQGNLAPILDKLANPLPSSWLHVSLDGYGDATIGIDPQEPGIYLLAVVRQYANDIYINSATIIEVVDHPLDVTCPPSVEQGDPLYVNTELIGATPGFYIHGAAMIKETAYSGKIKLTSEGSILSTELYLNDVLVADGALALATGDLSDLDPFSLLDQLMSIYGSNQLSVGYTIQFDSVTGTMSLSTSSLTPGDYILLVGVCKGLGSRIVGLYQTTVTVLSPPVANADGPYSGKTGVAITFDGTGSYDPDGTIVSYAWDFGDGGTATVESPSHKYSVAGTYTVTLTVTDNDGLTDSDTTIATVSTPPPSPPPYIPTNKPPVADAGPNQTVYVGDMTHFSGAGSYDPDGTIVYYKWDLGDGTTASGMNVSHAYSEPGIYTATLTVGDDRMVYGYDNCTITVLETIPPPPLPPILSNLTITPLELERGDNVTISLDIENIDSQSFTYIVTMHIENVNDPPPIWPPYHVTLLVDVELGAYESKTVSRTITMDTVGDFNVTVDGLTGNFTVETPEIPLKPAEFVVSDLSIEPEEAELGEGIDVCTFKISVDVTNVGERTGSHTVELKVDGKVVESRTVILIGGKETSIVFDVTRGVGSYAVEVDGLTGSFLVKPYLRPMKPAEFEVSDLVLTPSEAQPGATIIVSAKIANIGEMEGNYTLELKLDGETVETESVTLAGGTSQEISFTISSEEEGTHTVEVYELSDSFTVKLPPPKKPIWPLIVIAAAIIAVLIYIIWIKTDWIQQLIERMGIDGDVHQELP